MSEKTKYKDDHKKQTEEDDDDQKSAGGYRSRRRRSKGRYSVRKDRIYDKVKRPRTPYTFYVMDEDMRRRAEKRAGRNGDIRMALADIWNNMSDKEKEEFSRRFDEDIKRYEEECREIDEQRKGKNSVKKGSRDHDKDKDNEGGKRRKRVNRKQNQKGTDDPEEYDDYGDENEDE
jgi:hypothetical protein